MVKSFNLMPFGLRRTLSKFIFVGVASGSALLAGLVPALQPPSSHGPAALKFDSAAYAQSVQAITSAELRNYARSLLEIEPIRQTAYDEIKRILGSDEVPRINCHQPESLANLDRRIRQIATNYCDRSIQIVERNDLTITRFNTITVNMRRNPALLPQIQDLILQFQQQSP
jgi:hypothetical protein